MNREQLLVIVTSAADHAREIANSGVDVQPIVMPFRLSKSDPGQIAEMTTIPLGSLMNRSKELTRIVVHTMLMGTHSDGYIFVTEAWASAMLPGETEEDALNSTPSERPNRVSILKVSGRLRTGESLSLFCEASNLCGDRFTKPFEVYDGEETGRFGNFFLSEAVDVPAKAP